MVRKQFKPAWWLRNRHLQTLWPVFLRRNNKKVPLERQRLELPDGDFIDLDWVGRHRTGPLVLVLHGFEGSIESHYARGILERIYAHGWRGVFMHFRGCSGEPNRLPRSYHSGETNDVKYVMNLLQKHAAGAPLAAVGFSLGGNVLLKWLGETGKENPLCAAVAVSPPLDLFKVSAQLQQGLSRCYQWYFLKCLRERLEYKFQFVPTTPIGPGDLNALHTLVDFDDKYTAPLHGFTGADEYYATASGRQYLHAINVPTLVLHAKDDPLIPEEVIPNAQELSRHVQLEVTETGGHVGFVMGKYPWWPHYWLEQRIPDFLQGFLK